MTRSSPFDAMIPSPEPPIAPDFTIANGSDLPILAEANATVLENDCWNKIGVKGDRSCPELPKYVHCRNCPVFTSAGQRLFEREPPTGHLAEWTKRLAEPEVAAERGTVAVLIFRVGEEWLATDISLLVEIAELRPIHTIPHRSNDVLAGLVNIRGELELCVSLGGLLGIEMEYPPIAAKTTSERVSKAKPDSLRPLGVPEPTDASLHAVTRAKDRAASEQSSDKTADDERVTARLMVVSRNGKRWVFQVDEVEGVTRFAQAELTNVPSTVSGAAASFAKGVYWHQARRIGCLDESRLFDALERSLT